MAFILGLKPLWNRVMRSQTQAGVPAFAFGTTGADDVAVGGLAGAPTSGTSGTFVEYAPPASLLVDVTNYVGYMNLNTAASPSWAPCGFAGLRKVTAKTTNYTLTAADVGGLFTTTGATGAVTFTLPAVATSTGYWYDIMNTVGQNLTVTAPANTLVAFNNATATSIAFSTASELIGSGVRVVCDGTKWIAQPILGSETATPTIS